MVCMLIIGKRRGKRNVGCTNYADQLPRNPANFRIRAPIKENETLKDPKVDKSLNISAINKQ